MKGCVGVAGDERLNHAARPSRPGGERRLVPCKQRGQGIGPELDLQVRGEARGPVHNPGAVGDQRLFTGDGFVVHRGEEDAVVKLGQVI